ncbi:hypothetical protein BDR26DRAFT_1002779 [Obelidium mucronatum]|nr:hypothetical protein BDR26DRAFT_1002779 [Obelidium mucronatum]
MSETSLLHQEGTLWENGAMEQQEAPARLDVSFDCTTRYSQPVIKRSLDLLIQAAESPLMDTNSRGWGLEDPDLMPSLDDFLLVQRVHTRNFKSAPLAFAYDGDYFLNSFFHLHPILRLTKCALAAHSSSPRLPKELALSYYNRARKACIKALSEEEPSYQTVQSIWNTPICKMYGKGRPELGRSFYKIITELIVQLRLDIDPDDSPWLFHLNLSPREKEDRRKAFWSCYWLMMEDQATSSDAFPFRLTSDKIKPPAAVDTPFLIFEGYSTMKPLCELYRLFGLMKRHFSSPPSDYQTILASESLTSALLMVHSAVPKQFQFVALSSTCLPYEDCQRLLSQLFSIPRSDIADAIVITFFMLASTCVLHRPRLYFTGLPSFHPMFLSSEIQLILKNAISQSLDAANRIACLSTFLVDITWGPNRHTWVPADLRNYVYLCDSETAHSMFQAMIVFWYVGCRMDSIWLRLVNCPVAKWVDLRPRLLEMMLFVKSAAGRSGSDESGDFNPDDGLFAPILQCMQAMLSDLDYANNESEARVNDTAIENLVVAMKVVSLDNSWVRPIAKEPRSFLGLLGMELSGGIRWQGSSEESWNLFWKSKACEERCLGQEYFAESPVDTGTTHNMTPLDHIVDVMETPLIDQEMRRWELEDPDLMPSIADYLLVLELSAANKRMYFSFDGDHFLRTFFHQPPALRLIVGAISAQFLELPELARSYYRRAYKAFLRASSAKPNYQTVQAIYNLYLFSQARGQTCSSHAFLRAAVDLIVALRLDVDPDDSPWLYDLNLSPRQKEDRRRAFWGVYWVLVEVEATSYVGYSTQINCRNIKAPCAINIPEPIFQYHAGFLSTLELLRMIGTIRKSYSTTPATLAALIASQSSSALNYSAILTQFRIAPEYYLGSDCTDFLSERDFERYLSKLNFISIESPVEASGAILLNLLSNASICVLHRPTLYTSMLSSCKPERLDSSTQYIIHNTITQTYGAACQIVHMFSFLTHLQEKSPAVILPRWFNRSPHHLCFFALFEGIVTLWFIARRMTAEWRNLLGLRSKILRVASGLSKIMAFMKAGIKFGIEDSFFSPLVTCIDSMFLDMGFETTGYFEDVGIVKAEGSRGVSEPRSFLGLLGAEIGGISWSGETEDSWRLFWTLQNQMP